jgi:hypothetical protein
MRGVIVLCSIFLVFFATGIGYAESSPKINADFTVFYDNNGNIKFAKLTDQGRDRKCKLTQGDDFTTKFLFKKIAKHKNIETLQNNWIKLSGSPDCIIYVDGWPICVCCP